MIHEGFTIRHLQSWADFEACVALQKETWGANFSELVPVTMLRLSQKLGGISAGAFAGDGTMAGFVFGMSGFEGDEPVHWSDMLAVRGDARNRGLGEALKRFQRTALLDQGVRRMYWTFDPLESKNAYLNFCRLGTIAREYIRDMYGETDSPLHRGIGTDRLVAIWKLDSDRVERRLAGEKVALPAAASMNRIQRTGDLVVGTEPDISLTGPRICLRIPNNIQQIKQEDPQLARKWRAQTRLGLETYLSRGYLITGFARGEDAGSYYLERADLAS